MMGKEIGGVSSILQGFVLGFVLVGAHVVYVANAGANAIPDDKAKLDSWFESLIKPVSERKDDLEKDLVEAETAPETITVRKDGSGKFKTITEAVQSIEIGNKKRIIISIGPGEYKEKIKVDRYKSYITFLGDPKDRPVLSFDGTAAKFGTVDSASVIVEADYFVGANLIVQNTAPRPDGQLNGAQAVALRISGDMAAFYNCRFIGFQDTLCDGKGRHFFKDCYVEGTVDFIFGDGRSLYLNNEIHIIEGDNMAVVAAHARKNKDGVGGYSFVHCNVTGTGGNGWLGRTWMDASRTVYAYCHLGEVVKKEGWNDAFRPATQKTVYFGEFKNKGPGADRGGRVTYAKELDEDEVEVFINMEYIEAEKWLLPPPTL